MNSHFYFDEDSFWKDFFYYFFITKPNSLVESLSVTSISIEKQSER